MVGDGEEEEYKELEHGKEDKAFFSEDSGESSRSAIVFSDEGSMDSQNDLDKYDNEHQIYLYE